MILLILNSCVYLCILFFYYKKKKIMDLGFFLLSTFCVSSIGSCWYYSFESVKYSYHNFSVVAFIYLLSLIIICLYPLLKIDYQRIKLINTNHMGQFIKISSVIFALSGVPPLFQLLIRFLTGGLNVNLGQMYENEGDTAAVLFSGLGKVSFAIIRRFPDIIAILLFYQLSLKKKNIPLILGLMGATLTMILFRFLSGSRGGVLFSFVGIFSIIIILKNVLGDRIFRNIIRLSLLFVVLSVVLIAIISLSRFSYSVADSATYQSSDASIYRWISQYMGEGMIRFNHTIWNLEGTASGDQNFSYFKKILGLNSFPDYEHLIRFYELKLGIPVDVFYTFIGDFFIDFGILGAFFLSIMTSMMLSKIMKIRAGRIELWQLVLILPFCHLFFFGFAANVYRSYYIQEELTYTLGYALCTYIISKLRNKPVNIQ